LGSTYVAFTFDIEPLVKTTQQSVLPLQGQQGDINMLGRIVILAVILLLPVTFMPQPPAEVEKART
jgi:hypothetical protein